MLVDATLLIEYGLIFFLVSELLKDLLEELKSCCQDAQKRNNDGQEYRHAPQF